MSLRIRLADEEEQRERDRLTFAAWGERLDLAGYLRREERLRAGEWARESLNTWLLVEGKEVLASCETYRMRGIGDGASGDVQAIATVYTEPALRGKGHASRLLELLIAGSAAEREDRGARSRSEVVAFTLFSDVGAPIYERLGFVTRPALDWVFATESGDAKECAELIVQGDSAQVEAAIAACVPASGFRVAPTAAQVDWHFERERVYAELLGRPEMRWSGARDGRAAALWMANWKYGRLDLLLLAGDNSREVDSVLRAARRVAHSAGLEEVRAWATPLELPPTDLAAWRLVPREGGLPMLRPLIAGVSADHWIWIPRAVWV